MTNQALLAIGLLMAVTLWMAVKHAIAAHQASRQRDIARHGETCEGRIVAIQRPFMLDACTRLYVDFQPLGTEQLVRACHIDRRVPEEIQASLPPMGATVTVRYFPDSPHQAVIGKLISL